MVLVTGPDAERKMDTPALGVSLAMNLASAASRRHEECSYYVRDGEDTKARVDAFSDGSVQVWTWT